MIYTFLSFWIPYRFCGRSFNSLSRVKFMVGPSTWAKVSLMSINLKVHIELHDHVLINHSWSTPLFGQSWPLHVCSILHPAPLHLDVMVILYLTPVATVVTESQIIAKKWISLFCSCSVSVTFDQHYHYRLEVASALPIRCDFFLAGKKSPAWLLIAPIQPLPYCATNPQPNPRRTYRLQHCCTARLHTRRCIGGASPAACCSGAQATPSRSRDGRDEHRWHLQPWQ